MGENNPMGCILPIDPYNYFQLENFLFKAGGYPVSLTLAHCRPQIVNVLLDRGGCFQPFLIIIHGNRCSKPENYLPDITCNNYPILLASDPLLGLLPGKLQAACFQCYAARFGAKGSLPCFCSIRVQNRQENIDNAIIGPVNVKIPILGLRNVDSMLAGHARAKSM